VSIIGGSGGQYYDPAAPDAPPVPDTGALRTRIKTITGFATLGAGLIALAIGLAVTLGVGWTLVVLGALSTTAGVALLS
jgi:hypothetical protein